MKKNKEGIEVSIESVSISGTFESATNLKKQVWLQMLRNAKIINSLPNILIYF